MNMQVRMETTEGLGRAAEVWVNGHLLRVCDGVSRPGRRCPPGLLEGVKLAFATAEAISWEQAARANPSRKMMLEPVRGWSYVGYGRVVSIMPSVVDFDLATMECPQWTTDRGLIGRYVRIPIDRLELVPAEPADWPSQAR